MTKINFRCDFTGSLLSLFDKGFDSYSVLKPANGRPDCIYLKINHNRILRFRSQVNELDDWDEIGSLHLDILNPDECQIDFQVLNLNWRELKSIYRLVVCDDEVTVECGLKFINDLGEFLIILPSSFPNRVEIKSSFYLGDFEPECDLDQYEELELKQWGTDPN